MRVEQPPITNTSELIVNSDLDFLGLHQVKNLANPADGEALRRGNKDVRNNEVSDTAAIGAVKISGTAMTRALLTVRGQMIRRGATIPEAFVKGTAGQAVIYGADDPAAGDVVTSAEVDAAIDASISHAVVEDFQNIVATGTTENPEVINDGSVGVNTEFTLNEYIIIELWSPRKITQFRFYKDTGESADDGELKIECRAPDRSWNAWVAGKVIPHDAQEWMSWDSSGGEAVCTAIKVTCTKVDTTLGKVSVYEIEVKY